MTTTQPVAALATEMKTALIRFCGEQRIAYNADVLGLFGKIGAGVAYKAMVRRRLIDPAPVLADAVAVPKLPLGLTLEHVTVLELIASGLSDQQLARRLGLSRNQASKLVRSVYAILDVETRTSAVALGYEYGLLGAAARAARKRPVRPPDGPQGSNAAPGAPGDLPAPPVAPVASSSRMQVLRLLAEGLDNEQIADRLSLTVDQVRFRVRNWYAVSGESSRQALAAWAVSSATVQDAGADQ